MKQPSSSRVGPAGRKRGARGERVGFNANPLLTVALPSWRSKLMLFLVFCGFVALAGRAFYLMGGVSTEQTWEAILAGNIVGMVNLYEAARAHRTRRIVFASSNHVTGFYRQDEVVTPQHPPRPDGF